MNAILHTSPYEPIQPVRGPISRDTSASAQTPEDAIPGPSPIAQRLCHLFRASLRSGRIHPLYIPVLRYRHAQLRLEEQRADEKTGDAP